MYPQREELDLVCKKVKKIFHSSTHISAAELIIRVNPIIYK